MFYSIASYYMFMKIVWFFSLVRSQIKFDTLTDHWLFLGILYTAGITFLSYVFIMAPQTPPIYPWRNWEIWLAQTLVLSIIYFWLMAKFVEGGVIFWTLLLLGIALVWF